MINELRELCPGVQVFGMTGPKMRAAGCESIADIEELSVMGIVEVLKKYPALRSLRTRLIREFTDLKLDAFIGIDVPDFVHHIEGVLRARGVKTIHYVAPQVWAWRRGRAKKLPQLIDLLLTIFPFEPKFFTAYGVNAKFVGHPLVSRIPESLDRQSGLQALGLPATPRYIALMPGSRLQELKRHTDLFLESAARLAAGFPEYRFLLGAVNEGAASYLRVKLSEYSALPVEVVTAQAHELLASCDAALVASGTVTMEALCTRTPMVVAVKIAGMSYQILRRLVKIPYVAMPNVLANEMIVPEFVQYEATADKLSAALADWLENPQRVDKFKQQSQLLRQSLSAEPVNAAALEVCKVVAQQTDSA